MRPVLFDIPLPDWLPADSLPIRSYGLMLALGFLAAIMVAAWRCRREGESPDHIYNISILALIGGVVGARLFQVIEYSDSRYPQWWLGLNVFDGVAPLWLAIGGAAGAALAWLGILPGGRQKSGRLRKTAVAAYAVAAALVLSRAMYIRQAVAAMPRGAPNPYAGFLEALNITSGGLTVYGGLILALLLIVPYLAWLAQSRGVNPLKLADIIAPSLALGLAFGRVGCFLNGCCFGGPADLPWCFAWPEGTIAHKAGLEGPIHPAQIYSCLNALLLFALLHTAYRHKRRHGQVIGAFFGLYALSRFLLEAVRSDEPKVFMGGLSVSQAVGVFALGGVVLYLLILPRLRMSDLLWQPKTSPAGDGHDKDASGKPMTRAERRRAERKK